MVWLALIGCSSFDVPFTVHGLAPAEATEGTRIEVAGDGFVPPLEAYLERDGRRHSVVPQVSGEKAIRFDVPPLAPGPYLFVLQQTTQRAQHPFVVLPAPPETPCKRPYQANTELSLTDGMAVIVRFHPDGRSERQRVPIDTIAALEVHTEVDGDAPCSAIHLLRTDGTRVLFEDGPTSLAARAATLGAFLDKPVRQ